MKPSVCLICLLFLLQFGSAARASSRDADSMQRKLKHIQANGRAARPNPAPTVVTEAEVNAYLASEYVQLPAGVQSVKMTGEAGMITGTARIDFDRVREGIHSSNPLLSIFSGIHEAVVVTHAHGEAGQGHVHVDSVSIDGIEVPRFILQLFVEKVLQPKYPEIALDSQFHLSDRIDTAIVGEHLLTITQK